MRLNEILALIRSFFPKAKTSIERHEIREDFEYLSLRIQVNKYSIVIRETWIKNKLIRYGYQLLKNSTHILRYNNVPHHKNIETFPHHKHVKGEVKPLKDYSLQAFLNEAKNIIKHNNQQKQSN